jgi:transcriptional regulator with XRE-family HTH domain
MLVSHVISVHTLLDRPSHLLENAAVSSENGTLKVGARLRRARLSKGLRMRDLAQAVGCDESMISKIEAGKVMPSLPMVNKMVRALDRDMASFFGLKIDEYKLVQKPNGFKTTLSIDLSEATVKTIGV